MQASAQEIHDIQNFITALNLQSNSVVIVEGKRDSAALKKIGYSGTVLEFHRFGGLVKFADSVAQYQKVIMLLDGDRKGKYLTGKIISQLHV